jgi:hypothetical protein
LSGLFLVAMGRCAYESENESIHMKVRVHLIAITLLAMVNAVSALTPPPGNDAKVIWGPDETKPIEEQRVVVRAKPQMERDGSIKWLVLPLESGESVKVYYPWYAPKRSLPDKEITFTLWWTKEVVWRADDGQEGVQWRTVLDSIRDGEKVYFDASMCRVHKIPMIRGDLEVHYGLIVMDQRAAKKFSGGPGWVAGGCVIMDGSPSRERGYRCERCVTAYQKWTEEERRKRAQRRE